MAKKNKQIDEMANKLERLTVEYVPIESIEPNSYNPNRQSDHDFELLQKSMKDDGFTQPIVVQREGRVIVDGEHRWRAADALGMKDIPVVFVDMTDAQRKLSTLRHNRARGSEDIELSAELLRDLRELGVLDYAQEGLMMDDVELQRMLDDVPAPELLSADEFSAAWNPQTPEAAAAEQGEDYTTDSKSVSVSQNAQTKLREQEKRLAQAKSEQEREQIRKESKTFRLVLVYDGDDAKIVKAVLGDEDRAQRLLDICTELYDGDDSEE